MFVFHRDFCFRAFVPSSGRNGTLFKSELELELKLKSHSQC